MGERCRSCDASVIWAITEKGKRIPVDALPVKSGNLSLWWSRKGDGTVLAKAYGPEHEERGMARYLSHFATCPDAGQHRKARG